MKNFFITLCLLILSIPLFSQEYLKTNYFNDLYVNSPKTITEDVQIDEKVRIFSVFNEYYKEITIIVYYDSKMVIDDEELERYYYEYLCNWKINKNHKYYKTTLVRRKKKYNRRIDNKTRCNLCEFYILILD